MRLHTRIVGAVSAVALTLGTAVVASAPAHASTDTDAAAHATTPASSARFDGVSISGLKKKLKQNGKGRNVAFTLNIAGSATDTSNVRYTVGTPEVVRLKSRISTGVDPYVSRNYEGLVGANPLRLTLLTSNAPGLYEIRIPVTQRDLSARTETTKTATKRFRLHATKKFSKSRTSIRPNTWIPGKTAAKFEISAPTYQKGAKVTMLYKKQGTKKFVKLGTKKLKLKKDAYSSTVKFSTKKLTKNGKVRFKFKKVKWAPGYAITGKVKVGRR